MHKLVPEHTQIFKEPLPTSTSAHVEGYRFGFNAYNRESGKATKKRMPPRLPAVGPDFKPSF